MFRKEEKSTSILKIVLTTIGVILFILTALALVYKFFKKHFKITVECGDCEFCDDDCLCEETDFEPECCVYESCCCEDCADGIDDDLADAIEDSLADVE